MLVHSRQGCTCIAGLTLVKLVVSNACTCLKYVLKYVLMCCIFECDASFLCHSSRLMSTHCSLFPTFCCYMNCGCTPHDSTH
jgi:hypothetical protein